MLLYFVFFLRQRRAKSIYLQRKKPTGSFWAADQSNFGMLFTISVIRQLHVTSWANSIIVLQLVYPTYNINCTVLLNMEIKCSISWSLKKWTGIDQNKIIGCYLYLLMCEILMWFIFSAREIKTHSKKNSWEIFEEMKKISQKKKSQFWH